MSAPIPAVTVTGDIVCALCGQVITTCFDEPMKDVQSLARAHQRSEVCG